MGTKSSKLSDKTNKNKNLFCCLRSFRSSTFSIDEEYLPTFDRLLANDKTNHSTSPRKQSKVLVENPKRTIEDLEVSLHGTFSIDQWIDSLPILGTPSLNRPKIDVIIKQNITFDDEQFSHILTRKSNRKLINLARNFQLNFYLKDFLNRLKTSKLKQTFKNHFSSSTIIYPCGGVNQLLTDSLNLFLISPSESILPKISTNANSLYKIHEQLRSKCYCIPTRNYQIEPDDDEYKEKSLQLDRTHVVITLETNQTAKLNQGSIELESSYVFISNNSFQTGFIRIDQEKISKEFLPFIHYDSEENISYLSSNLIQQWFNTLIFINQTCVIAKRFLIGDGSHITCLLKTNQSNNENSFHLHNNLTFAALRLPPCTYLNESSLTDIQEEKSEKIIDAFSPTFLSDNKKLSNDAIHIDYEEYSFAFLLRRWPKCLIDNYYTHPNRYSKRKWPSTYQMDIILKNSLLLLPKSTNHQWEINFDLIEENLFELMNESTLFFYTLCQQLFSQTYSIRTLIKHCFLNYCEKYDLPFSNNENNICELIYHFLKEIFEQINKQFFPNYFNHQINLLNPDENYNQWFDFIQNSIQHQTYLSSSLSSITISSRPIITEFLFYFVDQLYQTFHIKRSEFYLNDNVLLNLHKQLCEKLSNDTNNNHNILLQKFLNSLLNNKDIIADIQTSLTQHFETNAELVHTCLNQIRKAQTSLIFHYTWTIYIQYLHTYYNVLWNI